MLSRSSSLAAWLGEVSLIEWKTLVSSTSDHNDFLGFEAFNVNGSCSFRVLTFFPINDFQVTTPSAPRNLDVAHKDAWEAFVSKLMKPCLVFLCDRVVCDLGPKRYEWAVVVNAESPVVGGVTIC